MKDEDAVSEMVGGGQAGDWGVEGMGAGDNDEGRMSNDEGSGAAASAAVGWGFGGCLVIRHWSLFRECR